MISITLNEVVERSGQTIYWLAKYSNIPYVTLLTMSRKSSQASISLSVLSKLCSALNCEPADLLRYDEDDEDRAIKAMIKAIEEK